MYIPYGKPIQNTFQRQNDTRMPGFKSQPCPSLVMGHWATNSLSLSLLISKMGIIVIHNSQCCCENFFRKEKNIYVKRLFIPLPGNEYMCVDTIIFKWPLSSCSEFQENSGPSGLPLLNSTGPALQYRLKGGCALSSEAGPLMLSLSCGFCPEGFLAFPPHSLAALLQLLLVCQRPFQSTSRSINRALRVWPSKMGPGFPPQRVTAHLPAQNLIVLLYVIL